MYTNDRVAIILYVSNANPSPRRRWSSIKSVQHIFHYNIIICNTFTRNGVVVRGANDTKRRRCNASCTCTAVVITMLVDNNMRHIIAVH